ncbi:MAG: NmrA family NAD(P)-binding protein [Ardenticatenaceae bacterium]|nr:NmrA family NAD(P)-binding protein [Ardenticatenaceae bacterium]
MTTLVIGATGKVGRRVVSLLEEQGQPVRAATRHPESYPSTANTQAILFDYADHSTFDEAVAGATRAFVIAPEINPSDFQALLKKAGHLQHVVLMTAFGVQYAPESPLGQAEQAVKESGIPYTILRPNWFMQNFTEGSFAEELKQTGSLSLPAADAKVSFIDVRDIASSAVAALTDKQHHHKEYDLTGGQALTHGEVVEMISKAAGRQIEYNAISDQAFKDGMTQSGAPAEMADMLVGLFQGMRQGGAAPVVGGVKEATGREPITFEQYAADNAAEWR